MTKYRALITREFSKEWVEELRSTLPEEIEIIQQTAANAADISPEIWKTVDILYSGEGYPDPAIAPNLKWAQLDTAGVNHILETPLWKSQVKLTTLNGVAPPNMGEFAILLMLNFGHHLQQLFKSQQDHDWPSFQYRWDYYTPAELRGATVGVIGYGNIGREIGRLAHAFGMKVVAVDQNPPREPNPLTYQIPELIGLGGCDPDEYYPPSQILTAVSDCDYVILVLPYTSATHHMINADVLKAMKKSAVLINIARGGVVDEDALIQALNTNQIGGAALDVFHEEPLPASSPLWDMSNVLISPHIAGLTSHYYDRIKDLFSQNIRRFVNGQPLLNEVQRSRQY